MGGDERLTDWFVANWPRVGLVCAVVVLALLPALWSERTASIALAASLLPVYMVHQYEEHGHGRFVADFDAVFGRGLPVLTAVSAFWINVVGVWALILAALLLARFAWAGFLLVPVWLVLVNAAVHVGGALRERAYNPGLATAALLFLPWGGLLAVVLSGRVPDAAAANVAAALVAIAMHAAIVGYALRRQRALAAAGRAGAR
jgi:hypothetical protein